MNRKMLFLRLKVIFNSKERITFDFAALMAALTIILLVFLPSRPAKELTLDLFAFYTFLLFFIVLTISLIRLIFNRKDVQ